MSINEIRKEYMLKDIQADASGWPETIIIGSTENYTSHAGAREHALYLQALQQYKQPTLFWHYTIDDTYVFQHLPLSKRVEIKICAGPKINRALAIEKTAALVGILIQKFDIETENIMRQGRWMLEEDFRGVFIKKCMQYSLQPNKEEFHSPQIDDFVLVSGYAFASPNGSIIKTQVENYLGKVYNTSYGSKYPINIDALGWIDEKAVLKTM